MIPDLHHTSDDYLVDEHQLTIFNFWADWCSSCTMLKPVLNALEKEYSKEVSVISVNVDDDPELARQFKVSHIPALVFFKNGRVVCLHTGAAPYAELELKTTALLA